jgi:MscS family membrane protein
MLEDILTKTYYDNTISEWGISLLFIVGSVVVGKIAYWISSNTLRRLVAKTETKLDDIILDMIEEPIIFAVTVAGIWYGLGRLTLPETAWSWISAGVQILLVLAVTWLIVRLVDSVFTFYLEPLADRSENTLDDQILPVVRKGSKLIIWSLGIVVALNNAGYDVGAVLAGLGIGGLALAMAARDTVSNVFGGFTIFTDRPFGIHDRIRVNGFDGTVQEIGIRSTRVTTLAGTMVTIPNATFSDTAVENVSAEPSRKVTLKLGLTYDTSPEGMEKGLEILRGIVAGNDNLEEKVLAAFTEFGDFSMNLLFIYYIKKDADILESQTQVNMEILRQFTSAGLEFAFPTQTLYTIPQTTTT